MPRPGIEDAHAITHPVCPVCRSPLVPVRDRFVDRLLNVFIPSRRYRCEGRHASDATEDCGWVGNFPNRNLSGDEPPHTAFGDMSFGDMAQITLNAIGDAVLVVNLQGTVIYLNAVAETLTGWPSGRALGSTVEKVFSIVDGTTRQKTVSPSERAIDEGRIVELELGSVLIRRDGTDLSIEDSAAPIVNRLGNIVGAVIVFHDARESHLMTEKMSHMAHHDCLTDLPNRMMLMENLTQAIGMAGRNGKLVALLFMDLDHFKRINDSHGHAVGDHLLQEVAADITSCVRETDTVSRIGGDEFVVLLTQIEAIRDAVQIAEHLLSKFARPRIIDGRELQISLSIGISCFPKNGLDAATLIHNADSAMYAAKGDGRNNYRVSLTAETGARAPVRQSAWG